MNHGALGRLPGLASALRPLFLSPHFLFPLFHCAGGQYFPVLCTGCPMAALGTRPPADADAEREASRIGWQTRPSPLCSCSTPLPPTEGLNVARKSSPNP